MRVILYHYFSLNNVLGFLLKDLSDLVVCLLGTISPLSTLHNNFPLTCYCLLSQAIHGVSHSSVGFSLPPPPPHSLYKVCYMIQDGLELSVHQV